MSSDEDSDCTVGIQEDSGPSSPSILGPETITMPQDTLTDPTTGNNEMSQGYNLEPVMQQAEEIALKQTDLLTLSEIMEEQDEIEKDLRSSSSSNLFFLQQKVIRIEKSLKSISLSNQNRRKKIAEIHSKTATESMSSDDLRSTKAKLRKELVVLADNQKTLLSCFGRQKDLMQKLQTIPMTVEKPIRNDKAAVVAGRPVPAGVDLAQPVALDALVHHKLLMPGKDCLSCSLMGCVFKASLQANGNIQGPDPGKVFPLPQQWLSECWVTLGHSSKKINRKQAYKTIFYKSQPLMSYCEIYNMKQISSYQNQAFTHSGNNAAEANQRCSKQQIDQHISEQPEAIPSTSSSIIIHAPFNITEVLNHGVIIPHEPPSDVTSLDIPESFWGHPSFEHLSERTLKQLEDDLSF